MVLPVTAHCSNCGKEVKFPPPLHLNEFRNGKLKSFYFCDRRCFSIFMPMFTGDWKKSELDLYLGMVEKR